MSGFARLAKGLLNLQNVTLESAKPTKGTKLVKGYTKSARPAKGLLNW